MSNGVVTHNRDLVLLEGEFLVNDKAPHTPYDNALYLKATSAIQGRSRPGS
jgi:hypothetical protein